MKSVKNKKIGSGALFPQKKQSFKQKIAQVFPILKNHFKILKWYFKLKPLNLTVYIIIVILLALMPFLVSYIEKDFINKIFDYLSKYKSLNKNAIKPIINTFILLSLIGFIQDLINRLNKVLYRFRRYDMDQILNRDLTEKIASLDFSKHEDSKFQTKLMKVQSEAIHRINGCIDNIFALMNSLIRIVVSFSIIIYLEPILIIIIALTAIPDLLINIKSSKALWGIWDSKESIRKNFQFTRGTLMSQSNLKEIKIFGLVPYLLKYMNSLFKNFIDEQKKVFLNQQKLQFLGGLFYQFVFIGIRFWLLIKILSNKLTIGSYNFYISTINNFASANGALLDTVSRMYEDNLYVTDFFDLLEIKNEIYIKPDAQIIPTDKPPLIEFKNVSFMYPNSKQKVFENFNLRIEPGQDIALVGENGSGKTTLIKILCRFYDVTSGEILINGINIKDIDLKSYYENLGILFQDFNAYAFTAKKNIILGRISQANNKELMIKSAKDAGAHEFIMKFKQKYNQILSKWFTKGTELSGGQWQRVALARAFFRNANILILDEPTSAIDAKAEYEIFEKIAQMQREKTTIIISHRFSTVRKADKIFVLEKGKIIEQGSHKELLELKGQYEKMFTIQAEGYK